MKTLAGQIRMIKYGVIPNLPSFQISVGQIVGGKENLTVTEIVSEPVLDGRCDFHIQCCKRNEKGEIPVNDNKEVVGQFIWKTYKKEPDEIQYFVPDEAHNFLVVR